MVDSFANAPPHHRVGLTAQHVGIPLMECVEHGECGATRRDGLLHVLVVGVGRGCGQGHHRQFRAVTVAHLL